jgi:hypothetical protein
MSKVNINFQLFEDSKLESKAYSDCGIYFFSNLIFLTFFNGTKVENFIIVFLVLFFRFSYYSAETKANSETSWKIFFNLGKQNSLIILSFLKTSNKIGGK